MNPGSFLEAYWPYLTSILGIGFVLFGIFCNKIKLPRFLTGGSDTTYSAGYRIKCILFGLSALLYSLYYVFFL